MTSTQDPIDVTNEQIMEHLASLPCPECNGEGSVPSEFYAITYDCRCDGTGAMFPGLREQELVCSRCRGSGRFIVPEFHLCPYCGGTGGKSWRPRDPDGILVLEAMEISLVQITQFPHYDEQWQVNFVFETIDGTGPDLTTAILQAAYKAVVAMAEMEARGG